MTADAEARPRASAHLLAPSSRAQPVYFTRAPGVPATTKFATARRACPTSRLRRAGDFARAGVISTGEISRNSRHALVRRRAASRRGFFGLGAPTTRWSFATSGLPEHRSGSPTCCAGTSERRGRGVYHRHAEPSSVVDRRESLARRRLLPRRRAPTTTERSGSRESALPPRRGTMPWTRWPTCEVDRAALAHRRLDRLTPIRRGRSRARRAARFASFRTLAKSATTIRRAQMLARRRGILSGVARRRRRADARRCRPRPPARTATIRPPEINTIGCVSTGPRELDSVPSAQTYAFDAAVAVGRSSTFFPPSVSAGAATR